MEKASGMRFLISRQLDEMDCGPAYLKMVARHYGRSYPLEHLRNLTFATREGVSMLGISEAAEKIGFRTLAAKVTFAELDQNAQLPCILYWNQNHFVVLPPQNYDDSRNKAIAIADPANGLVHIDKQDFLKSWLVDSTCGVVLLLEPSPSFGNLEEAEKKQFKGFEFLFPYLKQHKSAIAQLLLSIFLGSCLSLIAPFLTQGLIDYGINHQNIGFVYLVLISQLVLFIGSTAIELLRGWILLHMNSTININLLSDFLIKLMKLPIRFFDTKQVGDIRQRMADNQRIQNFLSGNTISILFSFINLLVFIIVLGVYSYKILSVFFILSTASICWIFFYLERRKFLDYKRFQRMAENEHAIYELITGMQEIKLNGCEISKRWEWERIQTHLIN